MPLPTSIIELDFAVKELSENSQKWVDLSIEERINLVEEINNSFPNVWDGWSNFSFLFALMLDKISMRAQTA